MRIDQINIRGLGIQSPDLLKKALTHRSWAHENNSNEDNERLEFLGDAVLSLVVGNYLFMEYPEAPEGELARLRGGIVNTEALAKTAKKLNIGEALFLGKGEEVTGGREKESLLADTFEALIGAIYIENGLEEAEKFILSSHFDIIDEVATMGNSLLDAKSKLQETIQKISNDLPEYKIVKEVGPDHNKLFVVDVVFNGTPLGRGEGASKKIAQQKAAQEALEKWENVK